MTITLRYHRFPFKGQPPRRQCIDAAMGKGRVRRIKRNIETV